ncbi:MAG: LacI family DNA-binding transcriptional regulator [Anaerolineae bacterium]|nr:LacI family DNA-binding transcriptional regulator [Anaerolineae bacterium]
MPPTMTEVAERAGVSKSTVSLVLNNKPSVSTELQRVVLAAADELGYHLPRRRSQKGAVLNKSIVVVHYEWRSAEPHADSIFVDYISGIQSFVQDKNINLTFMTNYREGHQQLGYHLLSDGHIVADGAIIMGRGARHDGQLLHQFLERGIPMVVLSRNWPDLPISTVGQDHHQQACIALDHLIGLGHRRIAFLASEVDRQHDWFEWRIECYRQAVLRVNGQVDEELIVLGHDGFEAAQTLIKKRPDVTAIFAVQDLNAAAAVRGLQEMGVHVPQDISIIGLDDTAEAIEGRPALTTVSFPHAEVGYLAAELLLRQIENDSLYYSNITVRSRLVERESCAAPRESSVLPLVGGADSTMREV